MSMHHCIIVWCVCVLHFIPELRLLYAHFLRIVKPSDLAYTRHQAGYDVVTADCTTDLADAAQSLQVASRGKDWELRTTEDGLPQKFDVRKVTIKRIFELELTLIDITKHQNPTRLAGRSCSMLYLFYSNGVRWFAILMNWKKGVSNVKESWYRLLRRPDGQTEGERVRERERETVTGRRGVGEVFVWFAAATIDNTLRISEDWGIEAVSRSSSQLAGELWPQVATTWEQHRGCRLAWSLVPSLPRSMSLHHMPHIVKRNI